MLSSSSQLEENHQSPAKRRRLEQRTNSYIKKTQKTMSEDTLADDVRIKKERSPSPPLGTYPRLITSGSKHIHPMPQSCQKGEINYSEARRRWAKQELRKLACIGIRCGKVFVRDDGMVIDWTSPVPVWSDTLLVHRSPSSSHFETDASITVDTSSRISESSSQATLVADGNAASQTLLNEMHGFSRDDSISIDDKPPTSDHANTGFISDNKNDTLTPPDVYQQQIQPLEELAIEFLRRYVTAFDHDRASLKNAYSSIAQFSYQIHDIISPKSVAAAFLPQSKVERFMSRKNDRNLWKKDYSETTAFEGRTNIISALTELGPYKFSHKNLKSVDFNVIYSNPPPRITLISYGYLIDVEHEQHLSFDQIFVLQKRDEEVTDRSTPGLWPLVAICHQWVVRDLTTHSPKIQIRI